MSTYRKEWNCCGSVTETEAWEPDRCPFCGDEAGPVSFDEWWNSADADAFRASFPEHDGESFRPVWNAARGGA